MKSSGEGESFILPDYHSQTHEYQVFTDAGAPFSMVHMLPLAARPARAPPAQPQLEQPQQRAALRSVDTVNLFANTQSHIRADPIEYGKGLAAWISGTVRWCLLAPPPASADAEMKTWRSYTDYIGPRIFYDTFYTDAIRELVRSPAIQARISSLAASRAAALAPPTRVPASEHARWRAAREQRLREQLNKEAAAKAARMCTRMDNLPILRATAAAVHLALSRMYDQGVHISLPEFARFRARAVQAAKKGQSLVLVPCHKCVSPSPKHLFLPSCMLTIVVAGRTLTT